MNPLGTLPLLLLQLAAILIITNLCGAFCARLGQPRVVGEITGGLLLGPLAIGHLLPSLSALVFPPSRMHPLEVVSNISIVLFLFLIGAELDFHAAHHNRGASLAITIGSIAVPFALGAAISPLLLTRFGTRQASPLVFPLFVGIAMSITALPVLARIIQERSRKTNSANSAIDRAIAPSIASTALVVAAANDLLAWSLLAVTLTLIHNGQGIHTLPAIATRLLLLAGYVVLMLFVLRPLLSRLSSATRNQPAWPWLLSMVAFAFLSARITEDLGIHAFFGAFLAGVCVSGTSLQSTLHQKLQPAIQLTLPIFFALTGLRMQREMFSTRSWNWLAIILFIAVAGKVGGAMLAARTSGIPWKPALQIGILLNTRGLVELIALNIGYKEGIFTPALFTLFVLMALITTAMTGPCFDLSNRLRLNQPAIPS
jgi:Kef-type K+ transport system membrane component KefB